MQVGRGGVDAGPVEPQVGVRGRRVVPEAVARGSLRALQALLVVHAVEAVAVDRGHVRGLRGTFGWERADTRGGVLLVLVMGLGVDGVHHSPREIPEAVLERFGWRAGSSNKCHGGWSSAGSFSSRKPDSSHV